MAFYSLVASGCWCVVPGVGLRERSKAVSERGEQITLLICYV